MDNNQQTQGGAQGEGSGATSEGQTNSQTTQQEEMVSKAELQRVLGDMHKFKQAKQALESELAEIKKQGLKSQNDYKTLYEQEAERAAKAEAKAGKLKNGFSELLKLQAIREELAKAGAKPKAFDVVSKLDRSGIVVEVDDDSEVPEFNVRGVDGYVGNLKQTYGDMLFGSPPPKVDGGGGTGKSMTTGNVDIKDIVALEKTNPKKAAELWDIYMKQRNQRH